MDISLLVNHLTRENLLPPVKWRYKDLSSGTMSQVFLLHEEHNDSYILKLNKATVTQSEVEFLLTYQGISLLPDIVAVDSSYRYIVYTFMPGSTVKKLRSGMKELLQTLVVHLMNQYQPVSTNVGWGWQNAPSNSWEQFLTEEVQAAQEVLVPFLIKENLHISAPSPIEKNQNRFKKQPYLIHGDCGIHNLIFCEEKLMGVIDPTPILGYPHYDLIYAFFSSPGDLSKETLYSALVLLTVELPEKKQLYKEVLIGLYMRLAICVKHHPQDLPDYLEAWDYWNEIADNF